MAHSVTGQEHDKDVACVHSTSWVDEASATRACGGGSSGAVGTAKDSETATAGRPVRGTKAAPTGKTEELQARFGANLRHARLEAALTQASVPALAGIHEAYVSEAENGMHNVTLEMTVTLIEVVGVEVLDLLKKPCGAS